MLNLLSADKYNENDETLQGIYYVGGIPDDHWHEIGINPPCYYLHNPTYSHHYEQLQVHFKPVSEHIFVLSVITLLLQNIIIRLP